MGVRRPGSPIAGLKPVFIGEILLDNRGQKAWKPDCGIETTIPAWLRTRRGGVRRPGSPIAGLKLGNLLLHGIAQPPRQKAWKPDCGIETGYGLHVYAYLMQSEGLEARLRD